MWNIHFAVNDAKLAMSLALVNPQLPNLSGKVSWVRVASKKGECVCELQLALRLALELDLEATAGAGPAVSRSRCLIRNSDITLLTENNASDNTWRFSRSCPFSKWLIRPPVGLCPFRCHEKEKDSVYRILEQKRAVCTPALSNTIWIKCPKKQEITSFTTSMSACTFCVSAIFVMSHHRLRKALLAGRQGRHSFTQVARFTWTFFFVHFNNMHNTVSCIFYFFFLSFCVFHFFCTLLCMQALTPLFLCSFTTGRCPIPNWFEASRFPFLSRKKTKEILEKKEGKTG